MKDQSKTMKERVLGHLLSREELATVMSQPYVSTCDPTATLVFYL